MASRGFAAILWNYTWFVIFANVGELAFDSPRGAYPALFLGLWYTFRALGRPSQLSVHSKIFTQVTTPQGEAGEVIEAEFRREGQSPV